MLVLDLFWCLADALIILWLNFLVAFSMVVLALVESKLGRVCRVWA